MMKSTLLFSSLLLPFCTPQYCFDTRQKLHHSKRLRDIIISPTVKAKHLVILAALCRKHYDRGKVKDAVLPYLLEDIQAGLSRKHDIKEEQLRPVLTAALPHFLTCLECAHLKAIAFERIADKLPDRWIVLDKINHTHSTFTGLLIQSPLASRPLRTHLAREAA